MAPRAPVARRSGELSCADVDTLLYLALGGAVEAATIDAVWNASRGNVLFVRELVLGAMAAGRLVEHLGVWRLKGPLHTTERLTELAEERLAAVPAERERVLVTLALWEPVGMTELERVRGPDALEALENAVFSTFASTGAGSTSHSHIRSTQRS